MVKFVSVILAVAIFAGDALAGIDEDMKALDTKMANNLEKCKASLSLDGNKYYVELDKIRTDRTVTNKGGCFLSCYAKEFGIMNADNKFDKEKLHKILEPALAMAKRDKEEEKYNKILKEIDSCIDAQTGVSDACEVGKKGGQCLMDAAIKLGML